MDMWVILVHESICIIIIIYIYMIRAQMLCEMIYACGCCRKDPQKLTIPSFTGSRPGSAASLGDRPEPSPNLALSSQGPPAAQFGLGTPWQREARTNSALQRWQLKVHENSL